MSLDGGMNKQTVYPHSEILLSNKKKWTTDKRNNTNESQIYYAAWKKPD